MGDNQPAITSIKNQLFQVEILIEDSSHAQAISTLMQVLSHEKVKDFRITGGMELGKIIEAALQVAPIPQTAPAAFKGKGLAIKPVPKPHSAPTSVALAQGMTNSEGDQTKLQSKLLEEYRQNGTLIRLTVVKAKGIRLSMPCRILNFDVSDSQVTIYHVDEKRVYSFNLNEIEEMIAH